MAVSPTFPIRTHLTSSKEYGQKVAGILAAGSFTGGTLTAFPKPAPPMTTAGSQRRMFAGHPIRLTIDGPTVMACRRAIKGILGDTGFRCLGTAGFLAKLRDAYVRL